MENRIPGGDVNPYLAVAALVAAGLYGIEHELELEPEFKGNAYESDCPGSRPPCKKRPACCGAPAGWPRTPSGRGRRPLREHGAAVELDAFNGAVTDWERYPGFERL